MRSLVLVFALFTTLAWSQVRNIPHGSKDARLIAQAVMPFIQKNSAFKVKPPTNPQWLKRSGNWAFIWANLSFADPKNQGDGILQSLLQWNGRKWSTKEIVIGTGELEEMAKQWQRKYRLPKGLAKTR